MHITSLHISLPVLRLQSLARHFSPRPPTVFERALIELCARFSRDSQYNAMLVKTVFDQILGVSDPDWVLRASLENLVSLGVINCAATNPTRTELLALRDLSLTPAGMEMRRLGALPAKAKTNRVRHLYDPIAQRLLDKSDRLFIIDQPAGPAVSAEPFQEIYPRQLIIDRIPEERHPWWHDHSRVEDSTLEKREVRYQRRAAQIVVGQDAQVLFELEERAHSEYINNLDGQALINDLLRPTLLNGIDDEQTTTLEPIGFQEISPSIAKIFPICEIPDPPGFADGGVHFVGYGSCLVSVPEIPPRNALLVLCSSRGEPPADWIRWNREHTGALAYVGNSCLPKGCLYTGPNGRNLFAGAFTLTANNVSCSIPLGYYVEKNAALSLFQDALSRLEMRTMSSSDEDDLLLLLFWHSPKEVFDVFAARLTARYEALTDLLEPLLRVRDEILRIKGEGCRGLVERAFSATVSRHLEDLEEPLPCSEKLRQVVKKVNFRDPDDLRQLGQAIVSRSPLPATLEELEKIHDVFADLDFLGSIGFPSRFYSESVIRNFFERFAEANYEGHLRGQNAFETALRGMKSTYDHLKHMMSGGPVTAADNNDQPVDSARPDFRLESVRSCERWFRQWKELARLVPDFRGLISNTALEQIHRKVTAYRDSIGRLSDNVATESRNRKRERDKREEKRENEQIRNLSLPPERRARTSSLS
jgi:hypothetical protein